MKITINHPQSKNGHPVFVNDIGCVVSSREGIRKIRHDLGMTRHQFANFAGISNRTLEAWEIGRQPDPTKLFLLAQRLENYHKSNRYIV